MSALVQGSNEWLELRKTKIGASDAPIIMGISPWKTPYQLWQEKLSFDTQTQMTEKMKRGHDLEPVARGLFNLKTGLNMTPEVVFHPNFDWMMASLDGISECGNIIVEIKCPNQKDHAIAAAGNIPEKYYPQLQHQIAVSKVNMAYYFSFDGVDGVIVEVKRDEAYIEKLIKKEKAFYECMINRIPPELSDKDFSYRDDLEWTVAASNWKDIIEQLKKFEDLEKRMRETLIQVSGNSSCYGAGVRLTKVVRKGSIDYNNVPELLGVNLENYRKEPVESWRLGVI